MHNGNLPFEVQEYYNERRKKHLGRIGLGVILLVGSIMLARKDKLAGQGFMLLAGGIIAVGIAGYIQTNDAQYEQEHMVG